MADSDGNVTTVTGSVLNYQRELIEGHDEIVVEDAFMMLGGWNGFLATRRTTTSICRTATTMIPQIRITDRKRIPTPE